jgi:hypothetical protein
MPLIPVMLNDMNRDSEQNTGLLLEKIQNILEEARSKVYRTANTEMLRAYWIIGREIVEEEHKKKPGSIRQCIYQETF